MSPMSQVSRQNGGPVALVTGASRGIGLAIAREISGFHHRMVLVARSEASLVAAAAALRKDGQTVDVKSVDIADAAQVEDLGHWIEDAVGRLDVLVHAAGSWDGGSAENGHGCDLMSVNYHGPVRLTARLLPLLKAARGQIVFINSTQGLQASPQVGAYAASKFALRAYADSLRAEVNPNGVRVLTIYAGSTATAMQQRIHEQTGRTYRPGRLIQPDDIAGVMAAALLVPRSAEVTELTIRPMLPPLLQP
jgi:NADP-dependent 3-hydroxy acid dehydrogenase YdfG